MFILFRMRAQNNFLETAENECGGGRRKAAVYHNSSSIRYYRATRVIYYTMAVNASDRIAVNVGGRLFETTTTTLESGSQFFKALLGDTGTTLAGGTCAATKRTREEDNDALPPSPKIVYVDGDPDLFEDVLYFLRRSTIRSKTKLDLPRLEDLKTEAEFFSLDGLVAACDEAIVAIKESMKAMLKSEEPTAYAESLIVRLRDPQTIDVPEGKIVYIVAATLAGKCQMDHYRECPEPLQTEDGKAKSVPGCYLQTTGKEDSGDFQLLAMFSRTDNDTVCIAHVGMDHIHVGDRPVNYDFRQDLRLCLSPDEDGEVTLFATGSGDWHVVCWVGDADAIPQLMERPRKRRHLTTFQQVDDSDDEASKTMMLALLAGTTSVLFTASLLGLF